MLHLRQSRCLRSVQCTVFAGMAREPVVVAGRSVKITLCAAKADKSRVSISAPFTVELACNLMCKVVSTKQGSQLAWGAGSQSACWQIWYGLVSGVV